MKKITVLATLCTSILLFSAFKPNQDPIEALLKKLEEFTKKYPQEKVHLHLDKPYYAIGDDIWFKAYVVDGRTTEPTANSSILYVDLISQDDIIRRQLRLPIENGITWGDFKLTDTLGEGNFRIRAYTQLMRNAGSEFFFDKTLKIGNSWANNVFTKASFSPEKKQNIDHTKALITFTEANGDPIVGKNINYEVRYGNKSITKLKVKTNEKGEADITFPSQNQDAGQGQILATLQLDSGKKSLKNIPIMATSTNIDVQFFPEGGNLVEGISSKIAIKAINTNGLGKDVSGTIIDNDGNEAAVFSTTHLGMGSFFLSPAPGKTYTAKIKSANGTDKTVVLPAAKSTGAVLMASMDSTNVNVRITISPNMMDKEDLNLVAHKNGQVLSVAKVPTNKQVTKLSLDKEQFPSGILQLSLLSDQNQPIAERMVFIDNQYDKINIDVQQLERSYQRKEKVAINLETGNNIGSVQGNFSVAVTNTGLVKPDPLNETNILAGLLLTPELKGHVEKPNYYFIEKSQKSRDDLDNLLLTQGWSRVNWAQINDEKTPELFFKPEKSIKVSGTISKGGRPLPRSSVSLISNSKGMSILDTISTTDGKFSFEDLIFPDSTKFILQARSEKEKKDVKIDIDLLPLHAVSPNSNIGDIEVNVNQAMEEYLKGTAPLFDEMTKQGRLSKTIMLKEVAVSTQKDFRGASPYSDNLNGPGGADQVIDTKQLEMAILVGQYMQGRIIGVEVRRDITGAYRAYSRKNIAVIGAMPIVLDGVWIGTDLNDLNPHLIESIEVLTSTSRLSIYGTNAYNGLLVVTSKRWKPPGEPVKYAPGLTTFFPKGYDNAREFYSPRYGVDPDLRPDVRTTVYWNPQVLSDDNGKASFDYFNTDKPGNYRIVIEGMDSMGNLARKILTYQVN